MKSSKFMWKMEKIKAKWTQVSLKNVLKVKHPKLSRVLIVQNNVYAAVHGAIGEDRQTCKKNVHVILFTHGRACGWENGAIREPIRLQGPPVISKWV